jgi:hypothetical protein
MSLQITKREALIVQTNQAKVLYRGHSKVHYPRATKLPLVLDRTGTSPFTIQVTGTAEYTLAEINDARAVDAGFKDRQDFMAHWKNVLYGKGGITPAGTDKIADDAKIVAYRFRREDMVQKRLKVNP